MKRGAVGLVLVLCVSRFLTGCAGMRDWRGPEVIAGRDGVKHCALHKTPLVPKTTFQRKVPRHIHPLEAWWTAYLHYPNSHKGLLWDAVDQRTGEHTEPRTDWYCVECDTSANKLYRDLLQQ